jgi:hypothetical protein
LSRPSLEKFNFGDIILIVKKKALNVAKNVKCLNFIAPNLKHWAGVFNSKPKRLKDRKKCSIAVKLNLAIGFGLIFILESIFYVINANIKKITINNHLVYFTNAQSKSLLYSVLFQFIL